MTYDDSGNVIPLSQRFKPDNEDIRYSGRDYSGQSDLDLLEQASEDWTEERWKDILENAPELAGQETAVRQTLQAATDSSRKVRDLTRQVERLKAALEALDKAYPESNLEGSDPFMLFMSASFVVHGFSGKCVGFSRKSLCFFGIFAGLFFSPEYAMIVLSLGE